MNIMHAGGGINGESYTNSVEALIRSLSFGERRIELDCVDLKDGFGFAHDDQEDKFYNLNCKFSECTTRDFSSLRCKGTYTPLTLDLIENMLGFVNDLEIIVDSKFPADTFADFLSHLDRYYPNCFRRFIFQVYGDPWVEALYSKGGRRCLVALWKYFDHDPFSPHALSLIEEASKKFEFVAGVSVRWINPSTGSRNIDCPQLLNVKLAAPRVFFHGQDVALSFYEQTLLSREFGFFTSLTLAGTPRNFNPSKYKSFHPDLYAMNDLQATCHYLEHGIRERRRYR